MYADTTRCPGCRSLLSAGTTTCASCQLVLTGPLAWKLFDTLRSADAIVARMRALATTPQPPSERGVAPAASFPPGAVTPQQQIQQPLQQLASAPRRGMLEVGVPKLLLGLGAACLLVGSLVFLVVAWVLLGVGGRTAVLMVAMGVATASTVLVARRGLPGAAEGLASVAGGLVGLAVVGAWFADWLPSFRGAFLTVLGLALLLFACLISALVRRTAVPRLGSAAALAVLGGLVLGPAVGLLTTSATWGLAAGAAIQFALVAVARWTERPATIVIAGIAGTSQWAVLGLSGFFWAVVSYAADPAPVSTWALPLAAAGALMIAVAAWPGAQPRARRVATAAAAAVLAPTTVIWLHGFGADVAAVGWAVLLLICAAVFLALPRRWAPVVIGPAAVASVVPLFLVLETLGQAALAIGTVRPGAPATVALSPAAGLLDLPWIALIITAALLVVTLSVLRAGSLATRVAGPVAVIMIAATTARYPLPLALIVAELLLVGIGVTVVWFARGPRRITPAWWFAAGWFCLAATVGAASSVLAALALGALLVLIGVTIARVPAPDRTLVGSFAAPTAALWTGVLVGGVLAASEPLTLLSALAAAALCYLALPAPWPQVTAGVVALISLSATAATPDPANWLAAELCLVGVSALLAVILRRTPTWVAWIGALALLSALWVLLADRGVETAEAYTLPAAAVLLAAGLLALQRDAGRSTAVALAAGLAVGLIPSTLLAMEEPATLRALLVALAALVLILGGARLRWSAPVVAGALAVSALLLRALAPYTALIPPYALIIGAGVVLLAVGITWEARLRQILRVRAYVSRLR